MEGRRVAGGNGDFHIEGATFQDHPVGFNTKKFAADAIDHEVDPTPPEPVCPGPIEIPLGPAMATCNTSLAGQPLASTNFARTASETSSGVAVGSKSMTPTRWRVEWDRGEQILPQFVGVGRSIHNGHQDPGFAFDDHMAETRKKGRISWAGSGTRPSGKIPIAPSGPQMTNRRNQSVGEGWNRSTQMLPIQFKNGSSNGILMSSAIIQRIQGR